LSKLTSLGNCPNVKVHNGFANIYNQIKTQLQEYFFDTIDSVSRIVISGHSLGGAISSMVSLKLVKLIARFPYGQVFKHQNLLSFTPLVNQESEMSVMQIV
jgi:putative lipase involved disintegration of autophagic bodies